MAVDSTAVIYPNVCLGKNVVVEEFAIVGKPPAGAEPGEYETVIGDNSVIRAHTIIYAGNRTGECFQTGNKANIRECNLLGDNVSIGTLSVVEHHVKIGDNVRVHSQAFIPEYSTLHARCWIGPNVVLTNAKYPQSPGVKDRLCGPTIGEDAVIGANSTVLPGIHIREKSIVGAGSVVTKDVAPGTVVAGNPAVPMKSRSDLPY